MTFDLNSCQTSEDAIDILRSAAEKFYENARELEWSSPRCRFWKRLASELERVVGEARYY